MGDSLRGRVAIITGSGQGIGRAEAVALAREGASVVVNDLSEPAAEGVAQEIAGTGGSALAVPGDVTRMDDAQGIVDRTLEAYGRIDILVNNAGILRDRMFHNMTEEEWDSVVTVNLKGHFTVTRAVVPHLRAQRFGRIINTSSEGGLGTAGSANYSAAKEGIVGLSRALAIELGRFGVTVNVIRPRAWTALAASVEQDVRKHLERMAAGGFDPGPPTVTIETRQRLLDSPELMSPDVIASFVTFLCTDAAGAINGQDFIVGGDQICLLPPYLEKRNEMYMAGGWDLSSIQECFFDAFGPWFSRAGSPGEGGSVDQAVTAPHGGTR
jgi:3-oxoacyl-[acyl-carrier protein] reductase